MGIFENCFLKIIFNLENTSDKTFNIFFNCYEIIQGMFSNFFYNNFSYAKQKNKKTCLTIKI